MDQQIRGWIYIITNEAMPGLVKIGYSRKDPILRAAELGGTGLPYPYLVIYDVLVEDPQSIEKLIHIHFHEKLENKEWFKCSIEYVISEIKRIINEKILLEKYHNQEFDGTYSKKNHSYSVCGEAGCSLPPRGPYKGTWYCEKHWRKRSFQDK